MNVWEELHKEYEGKSWLEKPSIFAEEVAGYFPKHGVLLDLGAGQGQDSIYFRELGYEVICSDHEVSIIELANDNAKRHFAKKDTVPGAMLFQLIDLTKRIPRGDETANIIYAHLSLHYFDAVATSRIFDEIYRVLKPGGILAFLVNSTSDPEFGSGEKVEEYLYFIEGKAKRYFDIESTLKFTHQFEALLCDNGGKTYKDIEKGVHNLIRFVGRKHD